MPLFVVGIGTGFATFENCSCYPTAGAERLSFILIRSFSRSDGLLRDIGSFSRCLSRAVQDSIHLQRQCLGPAIWTSAGKTFTEGTDYRLCGRTLPPGTSEPVLSGFHRRSKWKCAYRKIRLRQRPLCVIIKNGKFLSQVPQGDRTEREDA